MPNDNFEILKFQACRDLRGSIQGVSVGRRNGRPAAFFSPTFGEPAPPAPPDPEREQQERLFVNLTPIECETWRKLLRAQSVASIAKEEGVSRAAIYARIQGNGRGQGGMIAKNPWILLWWRLRQRLLTPSRQDQ
ncbi:MAG TPA: hypothetical protein VGP68_05410 [Gemmataceae bacterium]|jgi:hypothetical protein|nr:hypothetical protein [Gemmataceae bacterium]